MKTHTLVLALIATISFVGTQQASGGKPQAKPTLRHKNLQGIQVKPSLNHDAKREVERSLELLEEFLALVGPHAPGNPGPFLPPPEAEAVITEMLFDHVNATRNVNRYRNRYDARASREKPENRLEGIFFAGDWIIIVTKDTPIIILDDLDDMVDNPAEYQGSDGDDVWDVLQGH